MKDFKKDFENFEDNVWLNAASEGPLPKVAAKALQESIQWKSRPYELTIPKFMAVPLELKKSIGALTGVDYKDVILANSASYGLHILANGINWNAGDEVLLMQNDFPTNILPWLALEKKGVKVRQECPKNRVFSVEEIEQFLTPQTRLLCLSHVHTFSGMMLDVKGISEICRKKGVLFVLNLSQSLGTMPVDVSKMNVDAIVCAGYKWLCGPYGTGFAWINSKIREGLEYNQAYWVSVMSQKGLDSEGVIDIKDENTARKFDIFGTANFFNFIPFKASIDYFLDIGLDQIKSQQQELIDYFLSNLELNSYEIISPVEKDFRSSLVVISHKKRKFNKEIHQSLLASGIYTALWKNNIRISPHVYNDVQDMEKLLEILNVVGI